jgi:aldehyde dehydrogenase (NAD+)
MANNTVYGLGGGLWTSNLQRAHVMARRHGSGHGLDQLLQAVSSRFAVRRRQDSGYGREMGHFAMHEYTEPKSVWVNVDAKLPVFYPR